VGMSAVTGALPIHMPVPTTPTPTLPRRGREQNRLRCAEEIDLGPKPDRLLATRRIAAAAPLGAAIAVEAALLVGFQLVGDARPGLGVALLIAAFLL